MLLYFLYYYLQFVFIFIALPYVIWISYLISHFYQVHVDFKTSTYVCIKLSYIIAYRPT